MQQHHHELLDRYRLSLKQHASAWLLRIGFYVPPAAYIYVFAISTDQAGWVQNITSFVMLCFMLFYWAFTFLAMLMPLAADKLSKQVRENNSWIAREKFEECEPWLKMVQSRRSFMWYVTEAIGITQLLTFVGAFVVTGAFIRGVLTLLAGVIIHLCIKGAIDKMQAMVLTFTPEKIQALTRTNDDDTETPQQDDRDLGTSIYQEFERQRLEREAEQRRENSPRPRPERRPREERTHRPLDFTDDPADRESD